MSSKYAMSLDANALLLVLHLPDPPPGHTSLRNHLGWQDSTYRKAKQELVDLGLAVVGHGGSLKRVLCPDGWTEPAARTRETEPWEFVPAVTKEAVLYTPFVQTLGSSWTTDRNPELAMAVHNTAHSGSRRTGGKWSRPDAVALWVRQFTYVPGDFLEVSTFEVKPFNNIDVLAVYEAIAHRRAATHAYVAIHVPAHLSKALRNRIKEVRSVAAAHGVGLVRFADPADYSTWKNVLDAERFDPDPERLDSFISQQLPRKTKASILSRLGKAVADLDPSDAKENVEIDETQQSRVGFE